jgi:hypothetical protein
LAQLEHVVKSMASLRAEFGERLGPKKAVDQSHHVSSCLIMSHMSYHSFRVERGHAMLEEPRLFSGSHSIILQQIAQQPINLYSRKSSRVKSH